MERQKNPLAIAATDVPKYFPLNPGTLANLRSQRKGPKFFKLGSKVVYRMADLERYVFDNPVQTVDDHDEPASGCRCKG